MNVRYHRRLKLQNRAWLARVIFVAAFGVMGVVYLLLTYAATPVADIQAEAGIASPQITLVNDPEASNGQAIKFSPAPLSPIAMNSLNISAGNVLPYMNQTELNAYFADLQALGTSSVRWDLSWAYVQPNNTTTYDWTVPDRIIATATAHGIKSLPILDLAPEWARKASCKPEILCPPADPELFANFAAQVVTRYTPRGINAWEIWNEPNVATFWRPTPNVADYTALLKATYRKIKQAVPSAVVLSGGLAPAVTSADTIAPITFIQALYDNGAKNSFDVLAFHPYSYPAVPSYVAEWNSWQQMIGSIRSIMVNNGDSAKKVWMTEIGAPTGGPGTAHTQTQLNFTPGDYMTESAQAAIMSDAIALRDQTDWLGPMFWYSMKDLSTDPSTPEHFFGLLRTDGSKKPAYNTYLNAIQNH